MSLRLAACVKFIQAEFSNNMTSAGKYLNFN